MFFRSTQELMNRDMRTYLRMHIIQKTEKKRYNTSYNRSRVITSYNSDIPTYLMVNVVLQAYSLLLFHVNLFLRLESYQNPVRVGEKRRRKVLKR